MPGFLDSVEEVFGVRDLYKLFEVQKDCKSSEIKKAYRKLSLKVHPDRAKPEDVEYATNKFQVLCKAYLILSDDNKRSVYDDTGCVDDEDKDIQDRDWSEYWRLLFPRITTEDIINFEKKYKKSNDEKEDLKAAYLKHEGDMDKIFEEVMLATMNDEPRFMGLIAEWIADGSVPSYPAFSGETEEKRKKRKRKFEKENTECDALKNELGIGSSSSLESLIQANQTKREKELGSFFDKLEEKYAKKPKTAKNTRKKKK